MALHIQQIENLYNTFCSLLYEDKFLEALGHLRKLAEETHVNDYLLDCEEIQQNYQMLLEYNFKGTPDPQRDVIHSKLKVTALELADKVRQQALTLTGMSVYQLKKQLEKEKESSKAEAARRIDTYSFDLEFSRLLNESELTSSETDTGTTPAISPRLFQLMWLSEKYTESDQQLISSIRTSGSLPWYEKCLAVSAISLSLFDCFDKEKFLALCDFYTDRQPQVWQRALTGLVVGIMMYDQRLDLYPMVKERIVSLNLNEHFSDDLKSLVIQFLKTLETEKLTREFRNEILPDVQKFESKLREKLDLDNIINNELIEDKNPDWEQIFEDSPDLLSKIEKMSEMQMDGLDLFMGTFAMLKNFDFFREISNWLRPFYKENPDVVKSISDEMEGKEAFLAGLEDSFYMCNSDKYSFCFNINYLPAEQSRNVIGLFNMEAESMREIRNEDALLQKAGHDTYIFTQYIQDLYRFFKLYPFRADFKDIFGIQWNILNSWLLSNTEDNSSLIRSCAEFYFQKEYFGRAANLYLRLLESGEPDQAVIEKTAYCYQRTGNYREALKYYQQAELFDSNRVWSLKKIIYCYRKLGDNEQALKWAREAELLAPDDVYIQTMLGNCHFDKQDFAQAVEHYFKVEFLSPGTVKVLRPIAWCSFMLKKYDIARNYLLQILQNDPEAADLLNLGHVELCSVNKHKAIECYLVAIAKADSGFGWFAESFENDRPFLLAGGLTDFELRLTEDFVRVRFESR